MMTHHTAAVARSHLWPIAIAVHATVRAGVRVVAVVRCHLPGILTVVYPVAIEARLHVVAALSHLRAIAVAYRVISISRTHLRLIALTHHVASIARSHLRPVALSRDSVPSA